MLTLHGKAYHRIFDLQQQYEDMNVSNSSRFYIFDSEFAEKCSSRKLNADIADTLRTHIHENVGWAQDYRSAVDSVLNSPNLNDPTSPTPYIEFATSLVALMMVHCEVRSCVRWTSFGSWNCSFSLHFRATGQWKACSSNLPRQ